MAYAGPTRLPSAFTVGSLVVTSAEWTSDIVSMGDINASLGAFRANFCFIEQAGTTAGINTNISTFGIDDFEPEDYKGQGGHYVLRGCSLIWSAQYDRVGHLHKAGIGMLADPELPPRQAVYFLDIDGSGNEGVQVYNRGNPGFHAQLPQRVRWKSERVGTDGDPQGNLLRHWDTGVWIPLGTANDGNGYTKWKISNEIFGAWRDIGIYYVPREFYDAIKAVDSNGLGGLTLAQEFATGGIALADSVSRIDYSQLRALDSSTNRWHEYLDWKIFFDNVPAADQDYGFSVHEVPGKISSICGVSGEKGWFVITGITNAGSAVVTAANTLVAGRYVRFINVVGMTQINGLTGLVTAASATDFTVAIDSTTFGVYGSAGQATLIRYLLAGLTYQRADTFADLTFHGIVDITEGAATYNGPLWSASGALTPPFVQQDADRGFYLMNPNGVSEPACTTYTAPYTGSYRFVGDFARANTSSGSGDGADVSIVSNGTTLFTDHVTDVATVDPDDIWNNASLTSFDVSKALVAGELTRFGVAGTANSFDTTAFRVSVSFVKSEERTPAVRGDSYYLPINAVRQNAVGGGFVSGGRGILRAAGLRHQVYYFDDVDDAEIWKTIPDGVVAFALGQSESDDNADVAASLNASGQLEWNSTGGNNRVWLHTWGRGSRRPGTSGTDTPQATAGSSGFVPRGTFLFTNDLTLAANNLLNGRRVGFNKFTQKAYGFTGLYDSDTYVGQAGIVATAFQAADGAFVKTRIIARDRSSTTLMFVTTSATPISGYLYTWSRT